MGNDKRVKITSIPEKLDNDLLKHLVIIDGEIYVRHFLCSSFLPVEPLNESSNNFFVNQTYHTNIRLYKECLKNEDYDGLFLHIEKQYRLVWFIKNYKRIYLNVGEKKYYNLLRGVLDIVDIHYNTKKHYTKLLNFGNDPHLLMSSYERNYFDKLPNEFIIYRGVSSKKKLSKKDIVKFIGNSWTIDKKISIWFSGFQSKHYQEGYYYLLEYNINKEIVLSYFSQRKEKEIFIDYTKIDITKISITTLDKEVVSNTLTKGLTNKKYISLYF